MSATLSILIPHMDKGPWIAGCLASIFNERNSSLKIEVVVLDDASSSNHLKKLNAVLRTFPDIKFHAAPKRLGVSEAKNCLLGLAGGEFVWFVDADDHLVRGWSDLLAPYLIADVSPDIIRIDPLKWTGKLDNIAWYQTFRHCRSFGYRNAPATWFNLGGNCFNIFRRELIQGNKVSFNPRFSLGEDALFNVQVYKLANEILNTNRKMYVNNQLPTGSLSRPLFDEILEKFDNELDCHLRIFDELQDHPFPLSVFKHHLKNSREKKFQVCESICEQHTWGKKYLAKQKAKLHKLHSQNDARTYEIANKIGRALSDNSEWEMG